MSVAHICVREVDLVDASEPVWKAAERMHQRAVGCLIVTGDNFRPVGIVTDRDLVERVLAKGEDPGTTTVHDVMTHDPATVHENESLQTALMLMRKGSLRRLPVINDEDELVGLLSLDDVLMLLANEFGDIGQLIQSESPQGVAEDSVPSRR